MAGCVRVRRLPPPVQLKATAVTLGRSMPESGATQGGGAGRDVAPRSPSPFSPPARPFPDAAAPSRLNTGDISRSLPAHLPQIHPAPPKQLLIICR